MNRDTRQLDLHAFGLEVKRKREARHMTQEQLAQIVNRGSRTIMNIENKDSNIFYHKIASQSPARNMLVRPASNIKRAARFGLSATIVSYMAVGK